MASTPVMHDLEALDTKPRSDLGCTHKLIDIYATAHSRMLPHIAYTLTHPPAYWDTHV